MVFYKCEAVHHTPMNNEDRENLTTELAELSRQIYQKSDGKSMVFTAVLQPARATFGILAYSADEAEKQAVNYLRQTPFVVERYKLEETTYSALSALLGRAARMDFIADRDEVLEMFRIDQLNERGRPDFGEAMIQTDTTMDDLHRHAKELLFADTLLPELERIAQGNKGKMPVGHPVHYLLHCDNRHTRKLVYKNLLSALYQQGRIRNQRYSFLNLDSHSHFAATALEALYRCNEGGAVVVRYGDDESESEFGSRGEALMEVLCDVAVRYKSRVLTIFCLPAAANRTKATFLSRWGNTAFVELKEDIIDSARAQLYLKNKAKEHGMRVDKQLTASVSETGSTYTATQLDQTFDRWQDHKLRHRIYPQYESTAPSVATVQNLKPVGNAYERLQELVGLSEAKEMMHKALNFFKMQKLFANRGISTEQPSMHMVFTGNPGTAKTTVARLFAEIMRDNGLLDRGDLVEVGRADLVGKFVGHTAPLVKAAFARAKGGVLFIDEAYSLVDDRGGMFGDEAINTIVQEMENNREDTIVIFAGYPDQMETFLNRNPGLRSRIAFHIPFADYSPDELCAIAAHIANEQKLTLSAEAAEKLRHVFAEASKQADFGNGRFARNLIEKAKMAQANRLMASDLSTITDDQLHTLCAEDIEEPKTHKPTTVSIGFCA